jgi:hypothetical protein
MMPLHPIILDSPLLIAALVLIGWAALGSAVHHFSYQRARDRSARRAILKSNQGRAAGDDSLG